HVLLRQVLDEAGLHRVRRPHARQTICLELRADGPAFWTSGIGRRAATKEAHHILDVMPVLVSNHVCLGKWSATGAELGAQLIEEAQIQVDLLVERAVERPLSALGEPAAATQCACVE